MDRAVRVISWTVLFAMIAMTAFSGPVSAHSPEFPSGNDSLENAWEVHDPGKSWALYCSLPEGEVHYYRMSFQSGDRILLNLIVPVSEGDRGFMPEMALLGPGMTSSGVLPTEVEVPVEYGHTVITGLLPEEPTYEGFAPGSYYQIAELDVVAGQAGEYYVVVWEAKQSPGIGGEYGFPVGFREEFTIDEIVFLPFRLVQTYHWAGQEYWMVFAPLAAVMVLTSAFVYWRKDKVLHGLGYLHISELLAGGLIAGTGTMVLAQLLIVMTTTEPDGLVAVTIMLIVAPLVIGTFLIWKATSVDRKVTRADRLLFFILGLVSIVAWAGLLIGPLLAMIGAILPDGRGFKKG